MTVTHPHHPLYGQQVTVVRLRHGAQPDLVVRLPDGSHAAIAMHLTDYAGAPAAPPNADPLPLLDLAGLLQVVQLLDRLQTGGALSNPAPAQPSSLSRYADSGGR